MLISVRPLEWPGGLIVGNPIRKSLRTVGDTDNDVQRRLPSSRFSCLLDRQSLEHFYELIPADDVRNLGLTTEHVSS